MESALHNYRRWIMTGFLIITPSLIFWTSVAISLFFHNPRYVDLLLAIGGKYAHTVFTAVLPFIGLVTSFYCRKALQKKALEANLWHRETREMRVNEILTNCSALLLSAMVINIITS